MEQESLILKLNTKLYPKEIIFSAAYALFDKGYFIVDGDPDIEITVTIYAKEGYKLDLVKLEFYQELNNYISYYSKLNSNSDVVKAIVEKALFSANPNLANEAEEQEIKELLKKLEEDGEPEIQEIIKEIEKDAS